MRGPIYAIKPSDARPRMVVHIFGVCPHNWPSCVLDLRRQTRLAHSALGPPPRGTSRPCFSSIEARARFTVIRSLSHPTSHRPSHTSKRSNQLHQVHRQVHWHPGHPSHQAALSSQAPHHTLLQGASPQPSRRPRQPGPYSLAVARRDPATRRARGPASGPPVRPTEVPRMRQYRYPRPGGGGP